ncbi:MAG: rod shape-determining protein RodA, partial [Alphaproteobacteria bacterium]
MIRSAHRPLFAPRDMRLGILARLARINLLIVAALLVLGAIGVMMLYSVADGHWQPYASRQAIRFAAAFFVMIAMATIDLRIWLKLAYPAYVLGLVLLVAVEAIGTIGKGGQRWLDLGIMRLQPSEVMKVALVLALARYYHARHVWTAGRLISLPLPVAMIAVPVVLVAAEPDLGTALILLMTGLVVIFLAGAPRWLFVAGALAAAVAVPVVWSQMHDYQKQRVQTFLNPEKDPLGAGYQIIQSKIALGSGGVHGKGWLKGTQSHLDFLPEMKTDFIFTVLVEEFGLVGGLLVLGLFLLVIGHGLWVGLGCRNQFGRLLAAGLAFVIFSYVFINIGMVTGLLPVVGVPLPLISYGGSALFTMM